MIQFLFYVKSRIKGKGLFGLKTGLTSGFNFSGFDLRVTPEVLLNLVLSVNYFSELEIEEGENVLKTGLSGTMKRSTPSMDPNPIRFRSESII